jgi:hypothetical protein
MHTLELKLRFLECFPYVCVGKPRMCNVLSPSVHGLELAQNCCSTGCLLGLYVSIASSPGHSHIFNVARRKEGRPGSRNHVSAIVQLLFSQVINSCEINFSRIQFLYDQLDFHKNTNVT